MKTTYGSKADRLGANGGEAREAKTPNPRREGRSRVRSGGASGQSTEHRRRLESEPSSRTGPLPSQAPGGTILGSTLTQGAVKGERTPPGPADYPPELVSAVRRLSAIASARAVILFGSRARRDHDTHSDWDLCIVIPQGANPNDVSPTKLWNHVRDLGLPLDIVVARPLDLRAASTDETSLGHRIAREGRLLEGSLDGLPE